MLLCENKERKGLKLRTHYSQIEGYIFIGCDIKSEVMVVCCILNMSH